jgi:hypothetical protein
MANTGRETDLEVTASDTWSTPLKLNKGDSVSISIKGSFVGVISVRRWLQYYGSDPSIVTDHVGVANEFTEEMEAVDISGGFYYYQIGSDDFTSGTAYVSLQ